MHLKRVVFSAGMLAFAIALAPTALADHPSCRRHEQPFKDASTDAAKLKALRVKVEVGSLCPDAIKRIDAKLAEIATKPKPAAPTVAAPPPSVPAKPTPQTADATTPGLQGKASDAAASTKTPSPEPVSSGAMPANPEKAAAKPAVEVKPPPAPASAANLDARMAPAATRAPLITVDPKTLADFALFRECDKCPEMVILPAGPLASYTWQGGRSSKATVERFAISRFETTWEEWEACVAIGACSNTAVNAAGGDGTWGKARRPVIYVDWNDARTFAVYVDGATPAKDQYRLPSEKEWEYAARAGTTSKYSWGEGDPLCAPSLDSGANFAACPDDRTRPVGEFKANPWGLFDMHGNVWEWIRECYGAEGSNCNRILRGGSWQMNADRLISGAYGTESGTRRASGIGFRLARSL